MGGVDHEHCIGLPPLPPPYKGGEYSEPNNMRPYGYILITLIAILLCGHAEAVGKAPPKAEIAAIEAAYRSFGDISASFTQTTKIALLDRKVEKHGTFSYKKGGMLRIEYAGKDGPARHASRGSRGEAGGKHYVSDGTTLWTFVPGDDSSLETFAVDDRTIPREALSFLGGFGKLTKEFKVTASDAFGSAPAGSTALHLVPRKKGAQYESLDALFGSDHILHRLIVKNLSGNVSTYHFKDIRTNSNLPDSLFTLSTGKATPDTIPQ